jgi:hypothetical protein
VCAAALALLFIPSAPSVARAQSPGTRVPVDNRQVISGNPFLLMGRYFNAECERKHTESRTFGVSASVLGFDDVDYRNVHAFYRYYPQEASLTGFYIGAVAGLHRVSDDRESGNAAGIGFELGYSWLLGSQRNFAISVGGGATRLFGRAVGGGSMLVPTLRLVNIGWSF